MIQPENSSLEYSKIIHSPDYFDLLTRQVIEIIETKEKFRWNYNTRNFEPIDEPIKIKKHRVGIK